MRDGHAVRHTREFERVAGLPRRVVSQIDADAWADALTPDVTVPGSRARLMPWQAYGLAEFAEQRGAWLAYPVGVGKTLISYLAGSMVGAQRPVLIVPRALEDKTRADFRSYVGTWRTHRPPTIVTLSTLVRQREILESIKPDALIIDECDDLANPKSSMSRAIERYVSARTREECAVLCMTGTPSRESIVGYAHILRWCLRDGAPVPRNDGELAEWAAALDEKPGRYRVNRMGPGPLGPTLTTARQWYRRRLSETPGVVIVDGDSCDQPITIRLRMPRECTAIDDIYRVFLSHDQDSIPDDLLGVEDPLTRWRLEGFMGCGLYPYWDPPPPKPWRDARRNLYRFAREEIARSTYSHDPLDTLGDVMRAYPDAEPVAEWEKIGPTFKPNPKVRWFSTATIESALDWLGESREPGVVWCGSVEFGEALATAARLPYYGRKGQDKNGRGLHAADPSRSMVASWNANKKGFNLQAWRRQLIVHPPQSAKWLEQIFGRSHRKGQDRPVTIDVLATSGSVLDGFDAAIREARFARDTVGLTQKILRAAIVSAHPRITESNKFRYAQREKS